MESRNCRKAAPTTYTVQLRHNVITQGVGGLLLIHNYQGLQYFTRSLVEVFCTVLYSR